MQQMISENSLLMSAMFLLTNRYEMT